MKGRTVITSKEVVKKISGAVAFDDIIVNDDQFIWKFKTEDEAYRATIKFMNADVSYVHRK